MTTRSVLGSAARGWLGAMAMSGMRQVTTGLGWLEETPPEDIIGDNLPWPLRATMSAGDEQATVELAHWGYGAFAGGVFGLLPAGARRSRVAGPVFGVATWLVFELAIAPALDLRLDRRRTVSNRTALIADHVLYGIVVAGQLAPEPGHAADDADDDRSSEEPAAGSGA